MNKMLIPLPFKFVKYDARRFIAETLEFLKAISQCVCQMTTELSIYDDWYLKCQMPELWIQLLWALAHPNGPPPDVIDNAAIERLFDCINAKIQIYDKCPPLTYDVFFWKELENAMKTLEEEWRCADNKSFTDANTIVRQTMITVMRAKRDFFTAMAMMYV